MYPKTMGLREIRSKCHLTQAQAASLVGIPLRTYVRYENDPKREDSLKFRHALEVLSDYCRIDENKGILTLEDLKAKVSAVCKKDGIEFCFLFGSYSKNKATERSDVDLLVKTEAKGLDFYGIVEDFRAALCKKVDVIRVEDLEGNTSLMTEILKDGVKIYG